MSAEPLEPKRVLILCVDRDADLTKKAGIRGPVMGKEANIEAGVKLLLSDPEEADANAIFGAVKAHEEARSQFPGAEVKVATITGHPKSQLLADREILRELKEISDEFEASFAILVSDGADDETVLPILHRFYPTISIRRVIVQQSRQLEETYFLLRGYLKKLMSSPSARAYLLGIPGAAILIYSALYFKGLQRYMWAGLGILLGLLLMNRGFGLVERLKTSANFFGRKLGMFSLGIGALGLAFTVLRGYVVASELAGKYPLEIVVGKVLRGSSILAVGFMLFMVLGGAIEAYMERRKEFAERIFAMAVVVSAWFVIYSFSLYLEGEVGLMVFVLATLASFMASMISFLISSMLGSKLFGLLP